MRHPRRYKSPWYNCVQQCGADAEVWDMMTLVDGVATERQYKDDKCEGPPHKVCPGLATDVIADNYVFNPSCFCLANAAGRLDDFEPPANPTNSTPPTVSC